ncbi:glycosyltransferase family 2 protein [Cylindrobasidium torrendii FP15055 ss-10]|uniref:chitin synthase n=1 Tax=Cylindrobasidium torrendii FP15055 ss-10 TaxID=1314674 RepID=A0A0D7B4B5_9AGAR|nr:glycosyltransferase family 2 protein [Cylindrobasidium torrendii FP15055 ss-10]
MSTSTTAIASGDLIDLVSSSGSATIYPSDDAILAVLQSRFRADLPYTRISASHLVVVNPYKTLANVNNVSAKEYEERCYKDTSLPMVDTPKPLQPHLYDLAAKMYLLMRRRNESQVLLTRGVTGSSKSSSIRLIINQLLRLSSHSNREGKVAEQIKAVSTVLDSFGNAKTLMSPNASRHTRYLELHFTERGRISGAKVLAFGLDKSRLTRLTTEERSYHIFYQFLAGCTTSERDSLGVEDMTDYALLASSGCYRLPSGPFSDDSIAMGELRTAMRSLGFKTKSMTAIFTLLVAILELGNIQFVDGDQHDVAAFIANPEVLDHACRLLGISPDDLTQTLTNKTSYVRKELYTVLLNAEQAAAQRDTFVRDLYAILFAFVVETINHKLAPSSKDAPPASQIVFLDQPGYQTRAPSGTSSMALSAVPLVSAYGNNSFDEFCFNFSEELIHNFVQRNIFEDAVGHNSHIVGDGVQLPAISTMDNSACVELLRGTIDIQPQRKPGGLLGTLSKACSAFKSGKGGDHRNEDLLQDMATKFGVHASYVASPGMGGSSDRTLFGINHYAGPCSYDAHNFIEKDTDLLDAAFVPLLRNSGEPFVAKLFSGPSLAAEKHVRDENIVVQAQVSSLPLRSPTIISTFASADDIPELDRQKTYPVTSQLNFAMSQLLSTIEHAHLWSMSCIRPNDSGSSNSFDKRRVKAQIRALLLPDITSRRSVEFVADYPLADFCERYVPTMQGTDMERITQCARANGWQEGVDYAIGHRCIWLAYNAWKMVDDPLRAHEREVRKMMAEGGMEDEVDSVDGVDRGDDATEYTHGDATTGEGADDQLLPAYGYAAGGLNTPGMDTPRGMGQQEAGWNSSQWDMKESQQGGEPPYGGGGKESSTTGLVVKDAPTAVEDVPTTATRRWWLRIVWLTTWMIPTAALHHIGRIKRPDIQLAWREKLTIFWLIMLFNGIVIFYIVEFGRLLCPEYDKAWKLSELAQHTGSNDWWASVQGKVYDLTDFVQGDHSSSTTGTASNGDDTLDALAGQDLTGYFPVPLILGCSGLVTDDTLTLTFKNFTATISQAEHKSGALAAYTKSELNNDDWYTKYFLPTMKDFYKGPLVYEKSAIQSGAASDDEKKIWIIYDESLYDLTDYFNTQDTFTNYPTYHFIDSDIEDVFKRRSGQDVTDQLNKALDGFNSTYRQQNMDCLNNVFYAGKVDFRNSARCQVQNYLLLVFSGIMMASMGIKFLAALQLGSKGNPELQDKFVICQVPCYTEGEDSLRRTIDSLSALQYDDKRKLIFVICDGNIIGSGNDRTTPRIVLDILGVDPTLDPEPLLFKSVGEASKAINYGKVYSGLYEFEGHVVPYMVVVKVGKPTERSKPGNRGKRDSQILVMHYLNRVHFDAPMSPLELEIYHQMRNVIGIDPAFYEYIFTVDADTTVTPESLNRLVAASADDSAIIGICGETKVANEEQSWWTMIQVYEYYISHHLNKAFESLFGSVTCLPGCFSLYRIRTADKGRPIIISNRVIDEYSEPNVDTLHKKNLFSLGEDRFLTTLLMKHFPTFKTKFNPHAIAQTIAPDSFRILFSQRRRWINSTVHNLCELVLLPELFGFCCFSMRFFVFIDLLSTIILPATVVYLFYLIIVVAIGKSAFPLIAIIMLGIVYGLQMIIFILKREFMLIGWMVVYILSYPVYSFLLPLYSFWCMDEFSWGNTRLIVGEGKEKKVIINEEEKFDESMIPLKKFSDYEAEAWEHGSRHSDETSFTKPRSFAHGMPGAGSRAHSPQPYADASQAGDYYRDTNKMDGSKTGSVHQLRHQASQQTVSSFQPPHLPAMPFGGSVHGSEYGGTNPMMAQYSGAMGMPAMGYQNTGSVYGMNPMMAPMAPRNTMMGPMNPMFTGGSAFGGSQASGMFQPPMMPAAMGMGMGSNASASGGIGGDQRPMSTFSMATTMNPFASGPSDNANPSDEDLMNALRNYLSTQDLMSVSKKTAREAIQTRFPKADLSSKKEFLNHAIDEILSAS